jgi:hypothetical protein
LQAAEEEGTRGTVQQRYAYRPARRQDQQNGMLFAAIIAMNMSYAAMKFP